jgi:hypothetical protein
MVSWNLSLKPGLKVLASEFTRKYRRQRIYYRNWGLLKFCKHVLCDSLSYEKYNVFEGDLSGLVPEAHAKIPVNIRLLTYNNDDIDRLAAFWPDVYAPAFSNPVIIRELILDRLAAGEECIIAEYEGKIIYMTWHGFRNTHIFNPYVKKKGIGIDEALSYNSYCAVEYRGNNLQAAVLSKKQDILKSKGYHKTLHYVQPHNIASMKNMTKILGKPVQTLYCLNILGYDFYHLSRRKL